MTSWPGFLAVFAAIGAISGLLAGMFGIGGGLIRIPLFLALFPAFGIHAGIEMAVAAGTSLALAVPASLAAVNRHRQQGTLDQAYAVTWALALIPGVMVGVAAAPHLPQQALRTAFLGFVLLMIAVFLFPPDRLSLFNQPPRGPLKAALAGAIGAYCSSIGVGGGAVATPLMTVCSLPLQRALALGSTTAAVVASVGTVVSIVKGWGVSDLPAWSLGYVDGRLFLVMVPGATALAPLGVELASRMDAALLHRLYALMLVVIAVSMVI